MRLILLSLMAALLLSPIPTAIAAENAGTDHPEAAPFDPEADATQSVTSAIGRAGRSDKMLLIVMGANWCHDSRALAGWLATPRFAGLIAARYELVYVDVGTPQIGEGRNLDIAKRFGIKKVKNTPLVMLVSADGVLLNSKKDAVSWRNAASRSEQAIYAYFDSFTTD
jgi:thiol-disulfide isomerase/thioredoxin